MSYEEVGAGRKKSVRNNTRPLRLSMWTSERGSFDTNAMIGENRLLITNEPVEFKK